MKNKKTIQDHTIPIRSNQLVLMISKKRSEEKIIAKTDSKASMRVFTYYTTDINQFIFLKFWQKGIYYIVQLLSYFVYF